VDLVLLDARDPFGGGRLLPRGRLREPRSALRRARAILVTRADRIGERSGLARAIRDAAGKVPIGWARHRPAGVVDLATGLVEPPGPLGGRRAFAVSGIAAPESLLATLAELGARVVGARAFPDHHPFDEDDRRGIVRAARAAGADCIVTTEKDAVRLGTVASEGLRVLAVRIALEVMEGGAALCGVLGVWPGERDG
jgi:tetraacyldisaccharide 4'-kinase